MANKIRSIELENDVVATFLPNGMIELEKVEMPGGFTHKVKIHTSDLESIRDTARSNAKIEAGNGVVEVTKEKEKA